MKKLIAIFAGLFSATAFCATTVPVQLINPSGSTAGQPIVSTGATTAPAWGGVVAVSSGGTGATTASAALTNLGAAASGANTDITSLASPALAGATATTQPVGNNTTKVATTAFVLANAVSAVNATLTTPNIIGVTNGSNAAAGSVGEYLTASSPANGVSSATPTTATSVGLAAGDYDVSCVATFAPAGTTVATAYRVGVSTIAATLPGANSGGSNLIQNTFGAGLQQEIASPVVRVSLAASGIAYCVVQTNFSTSTMTVAAFIRARRIR